MIYLPAKHRRVDVIYSPDYERTGLARVRQRGVSYPDGCYNEFHYSLLRGTEDGAKEIHKAVRDASLAGPEKWVVCSGSLLT